MDALFVAGWNLSSLLAYIDPGIVSLALQSLCVVVFSATAGFLLGPWRWFASFFRRNDSETDA